MRFRDLFDFNIKPRTSGHDMLVAEDRDDSRRERGGEIKADIRRALARHPPGLTDAERQIMYGSEEEELELARLHLELRRLEAEVEETLAAAAKDRAEADRQRRSGPSNR